MEWKKKEKNEQIVYVGEEPGEGGTVREASPAYMLQRYGGLIPLPVLKGKVQGEYTLEDYYALPDEIRAELIDGVLYNMSAPLGTHQLIAFEMGFQISSFIRQKKGKCIVMLSPVDVQLDRDEKTMVQPDVLILCDREKFKNKVIYGAPDFVMEVLSPGTRKKDMFIKSEKYRKAGVREYWILDPINKELRKYCFEKGDDCVRYQLNESVGISVFAEELQVDLQPVEEILREFGTEN